METQSELVAAVRAVAEGLDPHDSVLPDSGYQAQTEELLATLDRLLDRRPPQLQENAWLNHLASCVTGAILAKATRPDPATLLAVMALALPLSQVSAALIQLGYVLGFVEGGVAGAMGDAEGEDEPCQLGQE